MEERENGRIITEAQLSQHGRAGLFSKGSRETFTKFIKSLNVVARARRDEQ